jgi:hypothetical protein
MSDSYNPAPNQPLNIFFNLDVGGLSNIYLKPDIPMEFHFKQGGQQGEGAGLFDITLLDETGQMVEPFLWNNRDPQSNYIKAQCQFGYQGAIPNVSPAYNMKVTDYKVSFLDNAFAINIQGSMVPEAMSSSNQYSGTVMDILNQYCKTYGLSLNVNPAFGINYMQNTGHTSRDTTAGTEMFHVKWVNESDWAYINRICNFARDQQGQLGYSVSHDTSDGNNTLNVSNLVNTNSNYVYNVQAKDSVVVAWQPSLAFHPFSMEGNDAQANGHQISTGDEFKTVIQPGTTQGMNPTTFGQPILNLINSTPNQPPAKQLFNYCSSVLGADLATAQRMRPNATGNADGTMNPFLNRGIMAQSATCEAVLTVLGDPNLRLYDSTGAALQVFVNCYYPENYATGNFSSQQLHYSSGLYRVIDIEHIIRPGSYHTVLQLIRAAFSVPTSE